MEPVLIGALQVLQPEIRTRWETLLRRELPSTPLANPAILARLFDSTLDEVFGVLGGTPGSPGLAVSACPELREICSCGRNPLIAYFLTGERALLETLIAVERTAGIKSSTATTEVYRVLRHIARREVGSFCSLCQHSRTAAVRPENLPDAHEPPGLGRVESLRFSPAGVHCHQP